MKFLPSLSGSVKLCGLGLAAIGYSLMKSYSSQNIVMDI